MRLNLTKALDITIEAASQSKEKHQVGAIIFDRSNYCVSMNRTYSCKVSGKSTPYSEHAEANVINHAIHLGIDLTKSTLVVVRISNKGKLLLSHPCKSCTKLINRMNIKRVYYSNDPLHRELTSENFKSL